MWRSGSADFHVGVPAEAALQCEHQNESELSPTTDNSWTLA
jgi:hypothetical protein